LKVLSTKNSPIGQKVNKEQIMSQRPIVEIDLKKFRENPKYIVISVSMIILAIVVGAWLWPSKATAIEPTPTQRATSTQRPTATPTILLQPTATPSNTPTPTLAPEDRVWAPAAVGAYLRAEPGGEVLSMIANGELVHLLGEQDKFGELDWEKVQYGEKEGWMAAMHIYRFETAPVGFVISEGAFLRKTPGGTVLLLMRPGTPLMELLDTAEANEFTWRLVTLPDGTQGWMAEFLFDNKLPTGIEDEGGDD
jgi:hypothetical protein